MSQQTAPPTAQQIDQPSRRPAPTVLPAPLRTRLETIQRRYAHGHDRPLLGYLTLSSTYGLGALALGLAVRRRGEGRVSTRDLALITVATHRLNRTLAKDAVASPLRAPFTRYSGPGLPSEATRRSRPGRRTPRSVMPWASS